MINLLEMSKEDRTLITIQCESFFLQYEETKAFTPVFKELIPLCKRTDKNEVWLFITACAKALKYDNTGSQFSLRASDYTEASKGRKKVSYRKAMRVIDVMEEHGYIKMYKGFYDHDSSTSIKSCFIMTEKILTLFEDINVKKFGTKRDPMEMVEIRDMETKQRITDLSKLRGIKGARDLVLRFNNHLQQFDIRIKGRKSVTVFKRVYCDDLNGAGRWYSFNGFQTASKLLRPKITINGVQCTEIDYAQIHPRILYTLEGVAKPFNFEPYYVPSGVVLGDEKPVRRFLKMAMMCLLYAKSKRSAIQALQYKLKEDEALEDRKYESVKIGLGGYGCLFSALESNNSEIKHWFYKKGLWAMLQSYDSKILADILERGIDDGIPMLPWHDSVVTTKGNRDYLITSMKCAWVNVLGTDINCFYSVEF